MSTTKKKNKTKISAKSKKNDAWPHFWRVLVGTLVFFLILFPFYSYQLQVIFDQRQCKGQSHDDKSQGGGEQCSLSSHHLQPPYYPCKDGNIKQYTSKKGAICPPGEHVKGPDWFTYIMNFSRTLTKDIYSILVGEAWITADKELVAKEKIWDAAKTNKGATKMGGGDGETDKTRHDNKTKRKKKMAKMQDLSQERESTKGLDKSQIAMNVLEDSLGFTSRSMLKNKQRSLCCERLKQYQVGDGSCESHGDSIFNYPPFNWMVSKKFGWPYKYIYDDPASEYPTAYNPDEIKDSGTTRWIGAWFAKTQQRSWSASRGIWSDVLSFFLPYLHEELSQELVEERFTDFIKGLVEKSMVGGVGAGIDLTQFEQILQPKDGEAEHKNLTSVPISLMGKNLINYANQFLKIKKNFKNEMGKVKNAKAIDVLFEEMKKTFWSKIGYKENIFLDFYIAATKPETLSKSFYSFFTGGTSYKYWFRYFTTLYMPILGMLIMMISAGTALIYTPFSSINRYSVFVLPLFFGFATTLFNMGAQPFQVFSYMLFGAQGPRTASNQCPYEGGTYQMTRNVKAYWPINLFVMLAIIITTLGKTLAASGNSAGLWVSLIFPIIIGLRLLVGILAWLWSFI